MNVDHLIFPNFGWGYMPPSKEVFSVFEYVQEKYKPTNVLEIGFHLGHSTTYMLNIFEQANMTSVSPDNENWDKRNFDRLKGDVIDPNDRRAAALSLYDLYGTRWQWVPGMSHWAEVQEKVRKRGPFDMGLVDGSHSYTAVCHDIKLCEGIDVLIADNWEKKEVRRAFEQSDYKLEKVFDYASSFKSKSKALQMGILSR